MFKYNYVADLFHRLLAAVNRPMQVELHPGPNCGSFHCRYCYGKLQRLNDGLCSIRDYDGILNDLVGKTDFIELSGIASDPTTYPDFYELVHLIKKKKFNLGLHTKGLNLTNELCKLLNTGHTEGDFVTISLDSAFREIYNEMHGCPRDSTVFDEVLANIHTLNAEKEARNSKLRVNGTYLLFADNSKPEDIERFIELFEPFTDVLRFSIPQNPNRAKPAGYLSPSEVEQVLDMLKGYEREDIVVLNFRDSEHNKNFKYCWAQHFNLTIDKAGNTFPCPQVATTDFNTISYGNVKEKSIWEIWNSDRRNSILNMRVDDMRCHICDRKDESINVELGKLLDPHRYISDKRT